jgi:serine/threonine protein kinase
VTYNAGGMRVGRYELFEPFGKGGMATVHLGKLFASGGFQRVVAIKVPHAQFVSDQDFRAMFLDEARIVARIQNPHVVATLDVIEQDKTLYQVMEYANGPPLSDILKTLRGRSEQVPIPIALAIMVDALEGLHAAHEAADDDGHALDVVHRDVSPHNILVTSDGVAKVIDFGIAAAVGKLHHTRPGDVKGKASYMAPEQVEGRPVDRRADVYAAGVVLYETLTGTRPFSGNDFAAIALMHMLHAAPDPRALRPEISEELAAVIARALEKKPQHRFATARAMADALLALPSARVAPREVAAWLDDVEGEFFTQRRALVAALPVVDEATSSTSGVTPRMSQTPTVIEPAVEARSVPRASTGRLALLGVTLLAGAGIGLFAMSRRPAPLRDAPSATAASSSPANAAPSEPLTTRPESAVQGASVAASTSVVTPTVRPRGASARHGETAGSAPTPSQSTKVQPPCCTGDLRIHFGDCLDNCPAGT